MPTAAPRFAVVVGAGPGLGMAVATRFAREGFGIGLVARDRDRLAAGAADLGDAGAPVVRVEGADAARPSSVADAVTRLAALQPLDVLVYNPSRSAGRLRDVDLDELADATAVNVLSAVAAVQAALPGLEQTSGTVLLTGGGTGRTPSAAFGVLSLGKAALRAAAYLLDKDLRDRGVAVRTVVVAGTIGATDALAPKRIADVFWQAYADRDGPVERVLTKDGRVVPHDAFTG